MMDDTKDPQDNVVDLAERRAKQAQEHEFESFLILEDPSVLVSSMNGHVTLNLVVADVGGVAMTPDAARELGLALIEGAYFVELQKDGILKDEEPDSAS